jgi:hypothetical protein
MNNQTINPTNNIPVLQTNNVSTISDEFDFAMCHGCYCLC